ncbi:hypothetical protein Q8A67_000141 [Cirrhinus molitorella]|uniref:Rho guanine nucleotide exchange factor 6/7 coiled-coil domain-containing protein n=1 Tax=Cirrhinus molitorella TaxID=172907 RepID=A0AA88QC53_9TELE|nr:hypothetical protein Q8A67_000141 [Cirrhinus molitorella]
MVAGGVGVMLCALPEMIDNWTELINGNHVTEASQSLRDTVYAIREVIRIMKRELKTTQQMLQEIEQEQQRLQELEEEESSDEEDEYRFCVEDLHKPMGPAHPAGPNT